MLQTTTYVWVQWIIRYYINRQKLQNIYVQYAINGLIIHPWQLLTHIYNSLSTTATKTE